MQLPISKGASGSSEVWSVFSLSDAEAAVCCASAQLIVAIFDPEICSRTILLFFYFGKPSPHVARDGLLGQPADLVQTCCETATCCDQLDQTGQNLEACSVIVPTA